jgi:hypothetical protein
LIGTSGSEEYSVEYDCRTNPQGETNYCIHFLARKPTMSQALLDSLITQVNALQLNTNNIALSMTDQEGCWDNGPGPDKAEILSAEQLKGVSFATTIAKSLSVAATPFITLLV